MKNVAHHVTPTFVPQWLPQHTPGTKICGKCGVTDGNNMTSWTLLVGRYDWMLKINSHLGSKIVALGDGMENKFSGRS